MRANAPTAFRQLFAVVSFFCFAAILGTAYAPPTHSAAAAPAVQAAPAPGLEIYMFPVGQADSMLVVGPAPARKTMLVAKPPSHCTTS